MKITTICLALVIMTTLGGCVFEGMYEGLAPGPWRASLLLDGTKNQNAEKPHNKYSLKVKKYTFEEVAAGELPFIFEVIHTTIDSFYIEIINGEERIKIPNEHIHYGKDRTNGHDTILIEFPHYDAYIKARFEASVLEGDYFLTNKPNYRIHFVARQGQNHRFSQLRKEPVMDISGTWETMFEVETKHPYKGIGEFKQDGNHLTGTFMTETGDYRYLEGTVQANKIYLSTFDGTHAFLFEGKILEDSSIIGSFRSGNHYRTVWEAKRNPNVQLKSAYDLTYLKDGYDKFTFSFPNTEGETVSINDAAFQNKAKIVQILGTWCPNCADETKFLSNYLKENPREDLAVIGLAYERQTDFKLAARAVNRLKERFDVPYDILIAGSSDKDEAAKTLPMLNAIISFPTMIFIDKNGQVKKIHTGFAGPATSAYEDFKIEFEETLKEILEE